MRQQSSPGSSSARSEPPRTSSWLVAVNSVLQAGADAIGKAGTLVLYAVMARAAGQEAFGDFTSATSLAVLMMIAAFGMDYRIMRLAARGEQGAGEAFWGALLLRLVLGLVAFALVMGVALLGPYDERVVSATAVLGLAMLVELTLLTVHAVFRGIERLKPVATALILYRGTLAIVGVALLIADASVVAVAWAWLGAAILALAYSIGKLRVAGLRLPAQVTRAGLWAVGVDSLPLGLAGVFGAALNRLDIVILGLLKDSDAVALYGAAYRLLESTAFLTVALALASFPSLARLSRTSTPTIADASALAVKALLIITAPIAVVFVLYAGPLIDVIYGPAFGDAAATLRLLAPAVVLGGLVGLIPFVLASQQRQWWIVVCLAAATAVNTGVNLVLIPSYAEKGVAVAMVIALLVGVAGLLLAARRVTGRVPVVRTVAGSVAGSAAMVGVGLGLGGGGLTAVPAIVAFGGTALAVEQCLYPVDAERILRVLRRRPAIE